MKTPDFVLDREFVVYSGPHDKKILEAGSFVRPISYQWIPKHIKDDPKYAWYNDKKEVFCYTRYGIICIFREYLREV